MNKIINHILLVGLVLLIISNTAFAQNPVAIPMKYNVVKNKQKFITLAAYSDEITYIRAAHDILPIDFGVRYKDAITNWVIESLPTNGTLYIENTEITSASHSITNPDELLYIPDSDFTGEDQFQFSVTDNIGSSNLATIRLTVESTVTLPKGIPAMPAIFNTPAPVPATTGNTETSDWYIDNSHANATDDVQAGESDPRHGTPDLPRLTLPPNNSTFVAGAQVFIAGGVTTPYTLRNGVSWHQWIIPGSASNPVYIIGTNNGYQKPIITTAGGSANQLRLQVQYAIFEGIHFKGINLPHRTGQAGGNIVFRHNVIDGMNLGTTGAGIAMNRGDNIVYYDVHIKNTGRTEPDLSDENDVHGIQISSANVWVIDNHIHGCAGDAIQINGEFAQGIYIGRNKLHSDNENAMDFKRRYDLVFVENDVWDYRAIAYQSSGSDGVPVIINHDTNGQTPTRSTIARNRIWDANGGVRHQGQHIWTTDNVFWHLHHNTNSTARNYAITVGNNGTSGYVDRISNNTFHKVDGGIWIWAGANSGIDHQYMGNNFGELNSNSLEKLHFSINSNHDQDTQIDYNNYMGEALIKWGGGVRNVIWMQNNTTNSVNSVDNRDPQFASAGNFDLSLKAGSPLIDVNIEHAAYQEFLNEYGISLKYDVNNTLRPQDAVWDIGAYEYISGVITPPAIITASLPDGIVDTAYYQTIEATGSQTPFTWSIDSDALPTGLELNAATGVISGTPATVGNFTFTIKLTDNDATTDVKAFSITITESIVASLKDGGLNNDISISPNPVSGVISINLNGKVLTNALIYNEFGQLIKKAATNEIDITGLPNGIYFVKIITKNGTEATKRILKN